MEQSRYCIGIDLGTSTCALSYLDTLDISAGVRVLKLQQWESTGTVVLSETLPSFVYLPPKTAWKKGAFNLPGTDSGDPVPEVTGILARKQATLTPDRVVHAAKSWLCHAGVNAKEPLLPWHSESLPAEEKISPVRASSLYLRQLKKLWDRENPDDPFEKQLISITVPASFDELASGLTLEAAKEAGYPEQNIRLLEEPQAAFYHHRFCKAKPSGSDKFSSSWDDIVSLSESQLQKTLGTAGRSQNSTPLVLVCDIGGGTTDFSLLEVSSQSKDFKIKRIAVSDHILLGGDNIDLKIAYTLEEKIHSDGGPKRLDQHRWPSLIAESRRLKEKILSSPKRTSGELFHVSVAGSGSSLINSGLSASVTRDEIQSLILDGFFPLVDRSARPDTPEKSGIREWGLPYAQDSAITKHLAGFLRNRDVHAVLFTGGSLTPDFLRERLISQLKNWQDFEPVALDNDAMELAVARGAAWSGSARSFQKGRVSGGYPRNLLVEVQSKNGSSLLCVVPKGYDSPEPVQVSEAGLQVRLNEAVSFSVYYHNSGKFSSGQFINNWKSDRDFHPMAVVQTRLDTEPKGRSGRQRPAPVNISLEASLSDTGLLTLCCTGQPDKQTESAGRWQLRFNVRKHRPEGANQQESSDSNELSESIPGLLKASEEKIALYYGKARKGSVPGNPGRLVRELEQCIGKDKDSWDMLLLRALWEPLQKGETRRGRSEAHEAAWFNLTGYILRPGYGNELDGFRVQELWQSFVRGMNFPESGQVKIQWWIMWRRVAGGLNREQQELLFAKIFPAIRKDLAGPEMYLLAGSLELISMTQKIRLGQCLTGLLKNRRSAYAGQKMWALSRLASRVPLYGGPENIVRPTKIRDWAEQLATLPGTHPAQKNLKYFYSQAGRLLNNRELDLPDDLRQEFISCLDKLQAPEDLIKVVREYIPMDQKSRQQLFGEKLPAGLSLADS